MQLASGDLARYVRRFIRGELGTERARELALRAGHDSFAAWCADVLPPRRRAPRVGAPHVLAAIERHRRGRATVHELWQWADELYHLGVAGCIAHRPRDKARLSTALALLSVICNEGLFPLADKRRHQLEIVRRALLRGAALPLERVLGRAFEDLPEARLMLRRFEDPEAFDTEHDAVWRPEPRPRPWADVVLIDRPYAEVLAGSDEVNWVIAFSVYTADWYAKHERERIVEAGRGSDRRAVGRVRRRGDRVPALRRRVPNFAFDRYAPRYLVDGDGIAEIVLEAPSIGPAERVYATKLFALVNRLRCVRLDGEPLRTLVVHPGGGRTCRRAG
ncbi:MAG: hypothetical protein D6776_06300 [Planctomycetota bacterium]|nr:MAG: hypothetical protein D6776_06300 [Planctomycetota bacterium]